MRLRSLFLCVFCAMLLAAPVAQAQGFLSNLLPERDESDVGFLTRLLQDNLSAAGRDVRITGFQGALRSRATFEEMTIADDEGVWLRIEGAAMQWNRSALLQRRIEIAELSAERVTVLRPPISEPREELVPQARFELPELPVSVTLDVLQLEEVILGETLLGEEVRAQVSGTARLADGAGEARLAINRLGEIAGRFELDAGFSNVTRILRLDLQAEEAPSGLAVNLLGIPDAPSAKLEINGEGPIETFGADIALATDGSPRVLGRFELQTALEGVAQAVRLELGGDLRPLLQEDFHPFFGADSRLQVEAQRFEDGRLSLDELDIRTEKLALRGRMALGADQWPELIDLRGEVAAPDGGRVLLPVAGARTSIEQAELRLTFDESVSEDWDLVLDLLGFENQQFQVESLFLNGLGRISSQGFGEDIDVIDALIDFAALGVQARDPALAEAIGPSVTGSLALLWRDGRPLLLPGFLLEGRDYALNGRARLDEGVVVTNVQAEFREIARLSALAGRPLSGAVRAQVEATLGPERDRFMVSAEISGQDLTLDQAELDRLLEGRSQITLDAQGADGQIQLHTLEATARTLRADLSGTVSEEQIDLSGEVDFADLAVLGGDFGGALDAQISVRGALERESVRLDAVARNLTVGQAEVNRLLRGETRLALAGQRDGAAFDLTALELRNTALTLDADGRYEAGASRLEADVALLDLGALRPGFGGTIRSTVQLVEEGTQRRVALDANAQGLRVGVEQVDALLAGRYDLRLRATQRPEDILLESLRLTGPQLAATVSGQIVEGRPALQIDARLASLATLVPGIPGAVTVAGTARGQQDGYALDLALNGPAGAQVQVTGSISNDLRGDLRAVGSTDLALINPRLEPRSIQGPARFEASLVGPLNLNSVTGTAEGSGITVVAPQQNLRLTDITAQAQLANGQASIDVRGNAFTGGRFALQGDIALGAPITGDLRGQVDRLRIVDPQLFETEVSGNLAITGTLTRGPSISGDLTLDRTEIRIPRVGLASRGFIPPNIQHLGESPGSRITRERAGIFAGETHGRTRVPASLDLSIDAPSRIFLRGRGLDAELGGSLRLTGTTADVIPIGQFGLIRGRLDLLGNRFVLNEGFASLQGDLVPFVRLAASTEREGVVASVVLQGRADAPEILFESSPELPQEEVVSLLLFGRGFETLSLFQAAQLASSLATLTGRSEGLIERLRRNVGLDDLDVRTDEDGETSLRLGRYLTENVYTDVELSPQGKSELSINIDLTSSVTARGRVDNRGRASVGVFFERDY